MPIENITVDLASSLPLANSAEEPEVLALMIAWSAEEPSRVGEVTLFEMEGSSRVIGRGDAGSSTARATFGPSRPFAKRQEPRALEGSGISREQARVTAKRGQLVVERLGRCTHVFRGNKVDQCALAEGDTLLLKGQALLLCTRRSARPRPLRDYPEALARGFGEPCDLGLLGESRAAWDLREAAAFYAKAGAHALVLGPSGAGKELVARAIHKLSARAAGPFVARNAATIPVSLLEAELFGNVKNYPNAGMPERPGLVGAAEGGTLFLDEIGDLSEALHASLLRLLDEDGEYHRLGEAKARKANLRVLGATNRLPETLKHDLLARLPLRLRVPGLETRRDDIPLFVRHLLQRAVARTPDLVARFVDGSGEVRASSDLIDHLLHKPYATHVRELDGCLWRAMAESRGARVERTEGMALDPLAHPEDGGAKREGESPEAERRDEEPTVDEIRASLAEHRGNLVRAAKAMGLPSRYALYRLLRKHGIDVGEFRAENS